MGGRGAHWINVHIRFWCTYLKLCVGVKLPFVREGRSRVVCGLCCFPVATVQTCKIRRSEDTNDTGGEQPSGEEESGFEARIALNATNGGTTTTTKKSRKFSF